MHEIDGALGNCRVMDLMILKFMMAKEALPMAARRSVGSRVYLQYPHTCVIEFDLNLGPCVELCGVVLCCAVLCCVVLCYVVLCRVVLVCAVLYSKMTPTAVGFEPTPLRTGA